MTYKLVLIDDDNEHVALQRFTLSFDGMDDLKYLQQCRLAYQTAKVAKEREARKAISPGDDSLAAQLDRHA